MPFDESQFAAALVAEMPDAVVYADRDGTIRFWNGGAPRIFGYTAAEAVGRSLDLIIPESLAPDIGRGTARPWRAGRPATALGICWQCRLCAVTGAHSIEFTILPFRRPDGTMSGIAAVMRDVTRPFEETRALPQGVGSMRGVAHKKGPARRCGARGGSAPGRTSAGGALLLGEEASERDGSSAPMLASSRTECGENLNILVIAATFCESIINES